VPGQITRPTLGVGAQLPPCPRSRSPKSPNRPAGGAVWAAAGCCAGCGAASAGAWLEAGAGPSGCTPAGVLGAIAAVHAAV